MNNYNVKKIDYKPNPTALKFHKSNARVRCLSGGYGSGKTTAGFIEVLKLCQIPNNKGMFLRKTYLELQMLVNEFESLIIDKYDLRDYYKYHERKQKIELFGNTIYLRSCDDPQKLKQLNLGWCLIDEAIEIEKEIYEEVLNGRLRLHNNTKLILLTNPDSPEHWIYQEYLEGKIEMFEMSTFENKDNLPKEFIENALSYKYRDYDYFQRNFLGKWVKRQGQVFYNVKEWMEDYKYDFYALNRRVIIGIDWGYSPDYTAVVFIDVFINDNPKNIKDIIEKYIIFDCIYANNLTTQDVIKMIEEKLDYYRLAKQDVIIYPDNAEPDRIAEMKRSNFVVGKTIKKIGNMEVFRDAYEYVNTSNVYYLRNQEAVKREINLFRYKKKDNVYTDIPEKKHKHIPDAIRYAVYSYYVLERTTRRDTNMLEFYIKMNEVGINEYI